MNKKGFMMAELVVVASIVLVVLVGMYTSYNKIFSAYNTRISYYDVNTLYRLGYYRDILRSNKILNDMIDEVDTKKIINIYSSVSEVGNRFYLPEDERDDFTDLNVFLVKIEGNKLNKSMFSVGIYNITFLEYIDYLINTVDFTKFNYMMLMEKCDISDNNSCNYAYLEVFKTDEEGGNVVGGGTFIYPTCSLSINSSGVISAEYNDVSGSGMSYYGWNSSYSGENSTSKNFDATGKYTYYIKDNDGNNGVCMINIQIPTKSCQNPEASSDHYYEDSEGCYALINGSKKRTGYFYVCPSGYQGVEKKYCYKIGD